MKNKNLFTFIILIVFTLLYQISFAQKTKRFVQKYSKGDLKKTYRVLKKQENIRHGTYIETYNDIIITKGQYDNDKRSGEWMFNNYGNKSHFIGSYNKGEKNGKWEYYSENNLCCEIYYSNGQKDSLFAFSEGILTFETKRFESDSGYLKTYYPNGSIFEIVKTYKNNKYGISKTYFQSGQLHREVLYENDNPMEVLKTFDTKGDSINGGSLKNGDGSLIIYKIDHITKNEPLNILSSYNFTDYKINGKYVEYYANYKIKWEGQYENGHKIGTWKNYNECGTLDQDFDYDSPLMQSFRKKQKAENSDVINTIYTNDFSKTMPEFPGGEDELYAFIGKNVIYPINEKKKGISGRVYVTFVINNIGEIYNVEIVKGVSPLIDQEVIRIINMMPRWTPGSYLGKPIEVQYRMPIKFSIH